MKLNVDDVIDSANSWDDVINTGIEIVALGTESYWMLGRLANRVADMRFDSPDLESHKKSFKSFCAELGQGYQTVKDAARVDRLVKPSMRAEFPFMSYGHWRELTKRGKHSPEELREWAAKASDNNWSVTKLREAVSGRNVYDQPMHPTKLMRRMVGNCKDAVEMDWVRVWKDEPDDITDCVAGLERALATIRAAEELAREQVENEYNGLDSLAEGD